MKYVEAINLWDAGIDSALRNGQLKLQRGQWVICGDKSRKSRFVKMNGRTVYAVHPDGTGKVTTKRFSRICGVWK